MTTRQKILLTAITGGVCGVAGVALYLAWRARERRAEERVAKVVRQLERVAERMHTALTHARVVGPVSDAGGLAVPIGDAAAPC